MPIGLGCRGGGRALGGGRGRDRRAGPGRGRGAGARGPVLGGRVCARCARIGGRSHARSPFAVFAAPFVLERVRRLCRLHDPRRHGDPLRPDRSDHVGRHWPRGLLPSSYRETLSAYFASGYPLGAHAALGAVRPPWASTSGAFQPFLAFMAAALALALAGLLRGVVESPIRARRWRRWRPSPRSSTPSRSRAASRSSPRSGSSCCSRRSCRCSGAPARRRGTVPPPRRRPCAG